MPVYAAAVLGFDGLPAIHPVYDAKVFEAGSLDEAVGKAVRHGYDRFPSSQLLAPVVIEISQGELLQFLRNQGISLTYDREAVKQLLIEGLESGEPDSFKDRQLQRIAFALGIDLGPTEKEE